MGKLHKLPQELINQIAAGEVVERPASVVKELIDNCIDANASEIRIKIEEGGLKTIEIADNGIGISEEDLSEVFQPHTTSKLQTIDDLNSLSTMGFRGEALSTIHSVSDVKIVSKTKESEFAYSVDFKNSNISKKDARNNGTTITISNLFHNTPARLKFMKTAETEYRKILDTVIQFAISQPNIHFSLVKDGKEIFNLPVTESKARIFEVLKKDLITRMIPIKSEGAGIKISGYISHPRDAAEKVTNQYIFINHRPIWDNGIAKSIYQGYSRFIPHSFRVPFIIFLEVDGSMVDVNVHPRKEEVKFINPYRVYSAVENCVSIALQNFTQEQYKEDIKEREVYSPNFMDSATVKYDTQNNLKEIRFDKKPTDFNISKSMDFSKKALQQEELPFFMPPQTISISTKEIFSEFKNIFQIFNKYIVVEFENTLWMIDQHAAAERITYEKIVNKDKLDVQNLLVPTEISISKIEFSFYTENQQFFKELGFNLLISEDKLSVNSIPSHIKPSDIDDIFNSLGDMIENSDDVKTILVKKREDLLATIACHGSVRAGQRLSREECINIYNELGLCENPSSCPHGRPAVWKLKLTDIDTNFYRTY